MKNLLRKRRFIVKIILAVTVLLTGTIVGLTIAFSRFYSDALFDALTAAYRDRLIETAATFSRTNQDLLKGYLTLVTSPAFVRFFHSAERSPADELEVRRRVRQLLYTRSEIHSITVYAHRLDFFISTAFRNNTEEADTERLFLATVNDPFVVVPREILTNRPRPAAEREVVLTYAFRVPLRAGDALTDMIVVNVHDPLGTGIAQGPADRVISMVLLTTLDGEVVSPQGRTAAEKAIAREVSERIATGPDRPAGVFRSAMDGEGVMVSYKRGDSNPPFMLVSIHHLAAVTDTIRARRNRFLLISGAVAAIGGLAVFFVTRRIYRPISEMISRINRQMDGTPQSMRSRENIEYVLDSFAETILRLRVLEDLNKTHLEQLRHGYLHKLMTDPVPYEPPPDDVQDTFDGKARVCVAAIDGLHRVAPSYRQYWTDWLATAIPNYVVGSDRADSVVTGIGTVAVVLWEHGDSVPTDDVERWSTLNKAARQDLNTTVTVGIGPLVASLDGITVSYRVAIGFVQSRFTRGVGRIFDLRAVSAEANETRAYPEQLEERLVRGIRLGDGTEIEQALDSLEQYIEKCRSDNARAIAENIFFSCAQTLLAFPKDAGGGPVSISEHFVEIESFKDFRKAIRAILTRFHEMTRFVTARSDRDERTVLIESVTRFVRENYAEYNLSIESLADQFGYTANYFGRVFKQATGRSLNDLIRSIRLERAKELLCDTEIPIHEIAARVGFPNEKYFYFVFKRAVGLTPQLYRNREAANTGPPSNG